MKAAYKVVKPSVAPALEPPGGTQLPENTNCVACSEDGRYLSLGHAKGLSVWYASSFICVAEWLQDNLEITLIQMTRMAEITYLIGTIDDMGIARVFAHHSDSIYLLSFINIMDDINKRSICLTFELHEGGQYGAASIGCSGDVCLEVYQFPSAAWLKELDMATSQKQDPNLTGNLDLKWSPITVMIKITQPKILPGKALDGPLGILQTRDILTHWLALDAFRSRSHRREKSFCSDSGKTFETLDTPRRCTHHFLLPCGQLPDESKADNQTDVVPLPDVVLPNAKEIVCSAVSRCTRYIALGLDDALVCVWDRRSGSPLPIILIPAENSALFRMQFVDYWSLPPNDSQILTTEMVHLFVLCKSGASYTVTTGHGTLASMMQLTERPKDHRDLPTFTVSVPFLRGVSLVVQTNGKMFLQDVINKVMVCFLTLPTSHQITSPYNPVYVMNTKQQALFIRGDLDTSSNASSAESSHSQLFVFHFRHSDIIEQYVDSHPDSPQHQMQSNINLDEIFNFYLQQRMLTVDGREKSIAQSWKKLQETAAMVQQRPHGRSQETCTK